eukprot:m.45672 g.45672  ORF g.45672 m.45672 type:complete len:298 (+) comp11798_c0_seq1:1423-2316(+)
MEDATAPGGKQDGRTQAAGELKSGSKSAAAAAKTTPGTDVGDAGPGAAAQSQGTAAATVAAARATETTAQPADGATQPVVSEPLTGDTQPVVGAAQPGATQPATQRPRKRRMWDDRGQQGSQSQPQAPQPQAPHEALANQPQAPQPQPQATQPRKALTTQPQAIKPTPPAAPSAAQAAREAAARVAAQLTQNHQPRTMAQRPAPPQPAQPSRTYNNWETKELDGDATGERKAKFLRLMGAKRKPSNEASGQATTSVSRPEAPPSSVLSQLEQQFERGRNITFRPGFRGAGLGFGNGQ